ncbi:hypothetical protein B1R94_04630 [Mycolicibacterium litorale]|nr:hypothetical protein B1R94_04630 [Mycolicibacterium litorale]
MNRSTRTWKVLAVGVAMAGLSFLGITTAEAAPAPAGITGTTQDCTSGGADATRCQTNGSTAIKTSPSPVRGGPGRYGPYISPDQVWLVAD